MVSYAEPQDRLIFRAMVKYSLQRAGCWSKIISKEVTVMRIFGIGIQELLVILLICLLIFGAGKLPEIGKALGTTIKEFKKSLKGSSSEDEEK